MLMKEIRKTTCTQLYRRQRSKVTEGKKTHAKTHPMEYYPPNKLEINDWHKKGIY